MLITVRQMRRPAITSDPVPARLADAGLPDRRGLGRLEVGRLRPEMPAAALDSVDSCTTVMLDDYAGAVGAVEDADMVSYSHFFILSTYVSAAA